MNAFWYVYILETEDTRHHYVGFTEDLRKRLADHNAGRSPYTAKYELSRLKTYIAFSDRQAAIEFENYFEIRIRPSIREEAPVTRCINDRRERAFEPRDASRSRVSLSSGSYLTWSRALVH
jgi:predicted GIY-YIG superfamily endonuclease